MIAKKLHNYNGYMVRVRVRVSGDFSLGAGEVAHNSTYRPLGEPDH